MPGTHWAPPTLLLLLCCAPCTLTSPLTALTTGEPHTHTHTHRQVLTPASLLCVNAAPCAPVTTCRPCATWLCWLPSPASWSRWMWTPWSPATPCWRSPTRWAHLHTHTNVYSKWGSTICGQRQKTFLLNILHFQVSSTEHWGAHCWKCAGSCSWKTRKMTAANMQLIRNYELDNELWQNILGLCRRTGWCALNNKADGLPYYRWRHSDVRLMIIAGLCLTFSQSTERLLCSSLLLPFLSYVFKSRKNIFTDSLSAAPLPCTPTRRDAKGEEAVRYV